MKKIGFLILVFLAGLISSVTAKTNDTYFGISGKLLWKAKLDIGTSPLVQGTDGTLFIVSNFIFVSGDFYQQNLYAVDQNSGQQIWTTRLESPVAIPPAIGNNNYIYLSCAGSPSNKLIPYFHCISPINGRVITKTDAFGKYVGLDFESYPLFYVNTITQYPYYSQTQKLVSMDLSGSQNWSTPLTSADKPWGIEFSTKWSMGPNGEMYGVYNFLEPISGKSDYSDLMGIRAFDCYGRYKWSYKITEPTYLVDGRITRTDLIAPPAIDREGNLYFGAINNIVYALNRNGELLWNCDFGKIPSNVKSFSYNDGFWNSPVIGNGLVYFKSAGGRVYTLSMENGDIVWETDLKNAQGVYSPILGRDGILYVVSIYDHNNIYALDATDGTEKGACYWTDQIRGDIPMGTCSITSSGIWYFSLGGEYSDGYLYALDTNGTHCLAQTAWPMAGANPQQTFRPNPLRPSTAVEITGTASPKVFSLGEAYPNPFNPSTTIPYALGKAGQVKLEIYNMAGQKVATLVDEKQGSGKHSVLWNASKFSSGLYFYTLQTADGKLETKKIVLLK